MLRCQMEDAALERKVVGYRGVWAHELFVEYTKRWFPNLLNAVSEIVITVANSLDLDETASNSSKVFVTRYLLLQPVPCMKQRKGTLSAGNW